MEIVIKTKDDALEVYILQHFSINKTATKLHYNTLKACMMNI